MGIITMKTYDGGKNKQVVAGKYNEETKAYIRRVKPEHFMRINQSYGIQEDVVEQLHKLGCRIIIMHTDEGKLYSYFEEWLKPNIKVQNFGNGRQRFYPVYKMKQSKLV